MKTEHFTRITNGILLLICLFMAAAGFICKDQLIETLEKTIYYKSALKLAGIVICLCLAGIFAPKVRAGDRWNRIISFLFFFASPLYIFFTTQVVTTEAKPRWSVFRKLFGDPGVSLKLIILNYILILLIVSALTSLTDNTTIGTNLAFIILLLFSIVNIYVSEFRGNAISAIDFTVLSTALDVAGDYSIGITYRIYLALLMWLFYVIISTKMPFGKLFRRKRYYVLSLVGTALVCTLGLHFLVFGSYLKNEGIKISYFHTIRSYRHYGVPVTFARSVQEAVPQKPEGYSLQRVKEIMQRYPSDPAEKDGKGISRKRPDIIIVIDESFTDLELVGEFETNMDPIPLFHGLSEKYYHGVSYASVRGGQTANTEFEFLTNHTMAFLPTAAVPFQIYIHKPMPSMAVIKEQDGYCGIEAFHPWKATNYNRDSVYPLLGFEEYYHRRNTPLRLKTFRGKISDRSDFNNLIAIYEQDRKESDRPWFFYNMTVQNHSPYGKETPDFEEEIWTTDLKEEYRDVDQYLSLTRKTDNALRMLFKYFRTVKEPTIIMVLGDHQPKLKNAFYEEIRGESMEDDTTEDMMDLYKVPFLIWSNRKYGDTDLGETSMNYLQTILAQIYGGPLTGYQKFLSELRKEVPVINAFGYYGRNGKFYETDDESSPYYEQIEEYRMLEYYAMFDKDNSLEGFYKLDITI